MAETTRVISKSSESRKLAKLRKTYEKWPYHPLLEGKNFFKRAGIEPPATVRAEPKPEPGRPRPREHRPELQPLREDLAALHHDYCNVPLTPDSPDRADAPLELHPYDDLLEPVEKENAPVPAPVPTPPANNRPWVRSVVVVPDARYRLLLKAKTRRATEKSIQEKRNHKVHRV